MRYLFCNSLNFTWFTFALSQILAKAGTATLQSHGLIEHPETPLFGVVAAVMVVSPVMCLVRMRWYPEAHVQANWNVFRLISTALSLEFVTRISSNFLAGYLAEVVSLDSSLTQKLGLALYVVTAVVIGRYLSIRFEQTVLAK